ncbi:hypothetical protein AAFF_G00226840 [Aldrovandia affinis]|uniref:Uncharacterized protein n=1 Tax=Aldrovandia affinis TaxID=143900 RepID=A0AAD7TBC5_9TELE|nr:hypothetical protein AAFF_G00226840 [Aldrovandia affinis]
MPLSTGMWTGGGLSVCRFPDWEVYPAPARPPTKPNRAESPLNPHRRVSLGDRRSSPLRCRRLFPRRLRERCVRQLDRRDRRSCAVSLPTRKVSAVLEATLREGEVNSCLICPIFHLNAEALCLPILQQPLGVRERSRKVLEFQGSSAVLQSRDMTVVLETTFLSAVPLVNLACETRHAAPETQRLHYTIYAIDAVGGAKTVGAATCAFHGRPAG